MGKSLGNQYLQFIFCRKFILKNFAISRRTFSDINNHIQDITPEYPNQFGLCKWIQLVMQSPDYAIG